jgi:hypothetical protein
MPLDLQNHGEIIRNTIYGAKIFQYYLETVHRNRFKNEFDKLDDGETAFKIHLINRNVDTNVVCFIIVPLRMDKTKKMDNARWRIEKLNKLNKSIYEKFTINSSNEKSTYRDQKFYLSKTFLDKSQYSYESIKPLLDELEILKDEYERGEGLFILRSTIMNPWYYEFYKYNKTVTEKDKLKTDYFNLFIDELHKVTLEIIDNMK